MTLIPARRQYLPTKFSREYNSSEFHRQMGLLAQSVAPQITRTVTAAYTVTTSDDTVLADASNGAFAVTLPLADQVQWLKVSVKKIDASGNAVTLTPSGANTIDGAASISLGSQYASRTVQSDGTTWYVLASV